jgi:hypothetical protein
LTWCPCTTAPSIGLSIALLPFSSRLVSSQGMFSCALLTLQLSQVSRPATSYTTMKRKRKKNRQAK